jgi:spore maturation protein A
MLNIIWPLFIIISYIYAIITGNVTQINNSVFESCESAVNLSITFLGTMCLWTGIMKIATKTSLINKLTKILNPIMKILFPDIKKEDEAYKEISMNMVANILGLGNAATPLGLKAMKTMQEKNPKKDTLTNSMAIFIIINTASIQIIPTTVIAIRSSLGSNNPTVIILPVWIATICAALAGIISAKILMKKY